MCKNVRPLHSWSFSCQLVQSSDFRVLGLQWVTRTYRSCVMINTIFDISSPGLWAMYSLESSGILYPYFDRYFWSIARSATLRKYLFPRYYWHIDYKSWTSFKRSCTAPSNRCNFYPSTTISAIRLLGRQRALPFKGRFIILVFLYWVYVFQGVMCISISRLDISYCPQFIYCASQIQLRWIWCGRRFGIIERKAALYPLLSALLWYRRLVS